MDGENNGKPYWNGWFGGTTIFGNTHMEIIISHYKNPYETTGIMKCHKGLFSSLKWGRGPESAFQISTKSQPAGLPRKIKGGLEDEMFFWDFSLFSGANCQTQGMVPYLRGRSNLMQMANFERFGGWTSERRHCRKFSFGGPAKVVAKTSCTRRHPLRSMHSSWGIWEGFVEKACWGWHGTRLKKELNDRLSTIWRHIQMLRTLGTMLYTLALMILFIMYTYSTCDLFIPWLEVT